MDKIIEKSLRTSILQQISKLNINNAQFYAMLRKINTTQLYQNQTFVQKLQSMKQQIRNKVKQLSNNIDLIYHVFDKKIATIIRKIQQQQQTNNFKIDEEQFSKIKARVKQLQTQLHENKNKYNAVLAQNQYLKNKNIALIQQVDILSKKKLTNNTNDSSKNINAKSDPTQDSLDNYGSPIQQQINPIFINNDLTFNKNITTGLLNKKIKSQQNSFSSLLIKQQNSFQPSYGSTDRKQSSKFALFGCMPANPLPQNHQKNDIKFQNNSRKNHSFEGEEKDQSHRLSFLINNLKQGDEASFVSNETSRYHFSRDQSANKSVLSKGIKKYHI